MLFKHWYKLLNASLSFYCVPGKIAVCTAISCEHSLKSFGVHRTLTVHRCDWGILRKNQFKNVRFATVYRAFAFQWKSSRKVPVYLTGWRSFWKIFQNIREVKIPIKQWFHETEAKPLRPLCASQGRNEVEWRLGQGASFATPMFEPEVFRKQMCCIEERICDITTPAVIRRPHSDWRPGNCAPIVPPRYAPGASCIREGILHEAETVNSEKNSVFLCRSVLSVFPRESVNYKAWSLKFLLSLVIFLWTITKSWKKKATDDFFITRKNSVGHLAFPSDRSEQYFSRVKIVQISYLSYHYSEI